MQHIININTDIESFPDNIIKSIIDAIHETLKSEQVDTVCVVNILITNDAEIQSFNRDYRCIDKATDVLSFPMQTFSGAGWDSLQNPEYDEDTGELPLGDIIVSYETVLKHAEEYGNTVEHEMAYMIIHSTLHLLGYDHDNESNEKQMHKKTSVILRHEESLRIK